MIETLLFHWMSDALAFKDWIWFFLDFWTVWFSLDCLDGLAFLDLWIF